MGRKGTEMAINATFLIVLGIVLLLLLVVFYMYLKDKAVDVINILRLPS